MQNDYTDTVGNLDRYWVRIQTVTRVVAVSLIWLGLPLQTSAEEGGKPLVAGSNCGKFVSVLPMDAEENPYSGKYEAWDLWVFDNAVRPDSEVLALAAEDNMLPDQELLRMFVTQEGYAVPLRIYASAQYSPEGSQLIIDCPYFISAVGQMVPTVRSELVGMVAKLRATSLPQLPIWLADDVPLWALILPSGEVVTMGALGSGAEVMPGLPGTKFEADGEAFFSYSANGELLGQTPIGGEWWKQFFVGFEEKLKSFNSSTVTYQELNGFIIFQDPAHISTFEVYDFRGNRVTDPTQIFRPQNRLAWIDGGNIPLVYDAQATLGDK